MANNDEWGISLYLLRQNPGDDKKAFEAIFKKYYKPVFSFCRNYLRDNELARDTCADVFTALWPGITNFEMEIQVRSFLFITAKNKILNIKRDDRVHKKALNRFVYEQKNNFVMNPYIKHSEVEVLKIVTLAIMELPVRQKQALSLQVFDDLTYKQIQSLLNIKLGTLKELLRQARKKLRMQTI